MMRRRAGQALLWAAMLTVLFLLFAGNVGNAGSAPAPRGDRAGGMPMTGTRVPELAIFDRTVQDLMEKWQVPGGSLAVVKDGRLILARGYGWAD
ncbi:MAG TPA: hypothetical protein VGR07_18420, partial [Thermoanaerobaculia bacterium]|nr:hypothetical protein [Thermoanaerobaculia bacterium]